MPQNTDFAIMRSKAQRNCESHIASLLFSAAKQIVEAAGKYRRGARITNEQGLVNEAKVIAANLENSIERYIRSYAIAATRTLGIDAENIESFLVSDVYGKTSRERNAAYLSNFAEDIVRMSKAGVMMKYTDTQLLSAVRTGYKDPYKTSVITKARKYDINIATPSYGSGIFHSAYQNLARNARAMVSMAWGRAEQEYGQDKGATGFKVLRGSSYPCAACDDETMYIHKFGDPFPPFHLNCQCYIKFIYNNKEGED